MKVNKLVVKSEQDLRNCLDLLYQEAKKGKHFYGMLELLQNDVVILEAIRYREKGKCKICAVYLSPGNFHCHHIDPSKPLSEINKTVNLVSLCNQCHRLVHSNQEPPFTERKMIDKLTEYRNKLKI
ncbi:HNH endonuclease [Geobacillus stearothermophilus]|uniref:HNH endonuclease n=1 Tax=Geobacillus stearothermophilus TaxID=1422 RepID=UPI00051926A2|nr:HNH endonuclease signature motif containing protein [Geobacillus stearothermophilus]MED4333834.1 HNH endonuclease signature motif containing protein [Geobacillus stearothermophilus]MED4996590.1 HNH endonuclease signature motif containing protein [Geobacillus stearothermophilus]